MRCAPGEAVELRAEPTNRADRHAIAVISARGVQIGYVTAERAPWIGSKIAAGADLRAIFQCQTAHGAVIRVNLKGHEPVLPKIRPVVAAAADETGFWPDYTPPDD